MQDSTTALRNQLEELLSEPIAAAQQRERTAFEREVESSGRQLVLFGAGNMGRRILQTLRAAGFEPSAFSDNNPRVWGSTIDGLVVLSPTDAATRYGGAAAFVVTVYNPWHDFVETRQQLRTLGVKKVLSVLELRWKFHDQFLPYFRDDLPSRILAHATGIRQGFELWSDPFSLREYVAHVQWRLRGEYDALAPTAGRTALQYFGEDFFPLREDEVVLDGGAFDGDTLASFLKLRGGSFRGYLALEPDATNLAKLNAQIAALAPELRQRIRALPYALGLERGRLRFAANGDAGSALSETGGVEVEVVSIDELSADLAPTYIKLDIEGAEFDALQGGAKLLQRGNTAVAACLYHCPDHLWSVPLLLRRLNPEFRLYLRPYLPEGWDLVCYALPAARCG